MSGRVLVCLAVLGVLISAVIETGARRQRKYGCRFSDHLCKPSEGCVDDGVFGYCMEDGGYYAPTSMYLDEKTAKLLEKEIRRLVKRGHTWSDPYTQCILGNVLDSYEANVEYDRTLCNQDTTDNDLDSDTLNLLQKLFLDKYSTYYDRLLRKDKKQGVHKVHKYLENDPIDYNSEMYLMPQQRSGGSYMGFWEKRKESPTEQYYNDLLRHSNDNDIQELRNYLATLRKLEMYENEIDSENPGTQYGGENEFVPDSRYEFVENPKNGQYVKNEDQYMKNDQDQYMKIDENQHMKSDDDFKKPQESPWTSEPNNKNEISNEEGNGGDEVSKEEFQLHTISPDDAKVLGELLENRGNIDSLPDDQIKRLTEYVGFMLEAIERGENGFPDGRQGDGSQGDSSQGDSAIETEKETDNQTEDAKAQDAKTEDTKETEIDKKSDAIPSSSKEEMPNRYIHTPHAVFNVEVKDGKNWLNEKKGMPAKKLSKSAQEMNRDAEELTSTQNVQKDANFDRVLKNYVYIETDTANLTQEQATRVLVEVIKETGLQNNTLIDVSVSGKEVSFQVLPNAGDVTATMVANKIVEAKADLNKRISGVQITSAGIGREQHKVQIKDLAGDHRDFVLTFVICGCIAGVLIAVVAIYLIQRHTRVKEKLRELTASGDGTEASADYQDLCRQHMQSKSSEKPEPLHVASRVGSVSHSDGAQPSPTSRSSTSSWSEEPVANNMDISTGHIVLSYMEDHLKNKDRLDREWEALCAYEAEPGSTEIASQPNNQRKNRYCDIMPYDHSRVVLNDGTNVSGSDYVNANTITDHDPRNPAYITTQGPLPHTVADFWQMVWEQGSVVIVMLTKLSENGVAMCHRYWPEEGSDLYHIYEVHLVSEHIWCEDFLVRSFYLKNLQTNETRTVTQFHFLSWTDLGVPTSIKTLLDFRRKVNKSYRGRSCPIVVHCSDGCGRSGTYILIDMVLNRMSKGAKEIDIAATLEHIRDQRMGMVKTKEQFEFVLAAVAEEVHAILKALPQ